jgi:hypothetical protein
VPHFAVHTPVQAKKRTGGATPYSAVREGDWKLIEFHEDGRCELYDSKRDPEQ